MYSLELTPEDVSTILFVGHRYCWSEILSAYDAGEHTIPEHEAWEISSAFGADTEGGHSYFPMLDHGSELAGKLFAFMDSIV